jgi:hypothetical protein
LKGENINRRLSEEVIVNIGMENNMQTVVEALKKNHFDPVIFVEKAEDARRTVLAMIPPDAVFVMAGSTTVGQLGLTERLIKGSVTGSADAPPNNHPVRAGVGFLLDLLQSDLCQWSEIRIYERL